LKKKDIKNLVVDDSPTQRLELQSLLEQEGYSVETASDGVKAMDFIKNTSNLPDVVLSDIFMPNMDGFQLCGKLKKDYPDIPTIILTAHNDEKNLQKAFKAGAIDYLGRPFSKTELLIRVSNVLRRMDNEEKLNQDIIELKKTEKALQKSEEKFRAIIDNIPDVIWTSDREGITHFISSNVEETYGYSPQEIYKGGASLFFGRIHPEDVDNTRIEYENLFKKQKMFDVEYRIKRKEGTWIWLRDRATSIYEVDGVMYADGIFSDITERKKVESDLIESQQRFKDTSLSTADWIWETDIKGRYTYCSKKAYKVLGYRVNEIIGKTPFDFMLPKEAERVKQIFIKLLSQKKPIIDLENWNICKDGVDKCLLTNGIPFFDGSGELKGYRGVDKDITERKEYEERLNTTSLELESAHKHAMYMLALASEYKDPETGNHIKRIVQMTTELALEMGIESKRAKQFGEDSILHDLGKLGISDYILLKPGKLTENEFETMKQHTLIGAKIIGEDKWFKNAKQIALLHHENWDGSGYPKGLKGEAIPLAARILAVADEFDALISRRPYKEAWSLEKTVKEIKTETEKHFDPKVVDAFLSLYKKGKLKKYT